MTQQEPTQPASAGIFSDQMYLSAHRITGSGHADESARVLHALDFPARPVSCAHCELPAAYAAFCRSCRVSFGLACVECAAHVRVCTAVGRCAYCGLVANAFLLYGFVPVEAP